MSHPRFFVTVDLQFFNGEKTEKATPQKRQDSRKKGQVAKSSDLAPAFMISSVFFLLMIAGSWMLGIFEGILRESLGSYATWEVNAENLQVITLQVVKEAAKILGMVFGVCMLVALVVNYLQVGVLFSLEPIQFKLEKLNPIEGFKKIFSMRTIVELFKSILKITAGMIVVYMILWDIKDKIPRLSFSTLEAVLEFTGWQVVKLGISVGMLLVILAFLDYLYQRFEYEKNLRMSKQDIKDEHKKMEGDPLIKSKIKERQRQMAMRRMMQEIPNADVIITNPTHFAVAIKYDSAEMMAPTVIAKGQDFLALKIREIAKEHRIVTMENKPLARALYAQVEIGQTIPEELFKAVAEVLAYVYKLQGKVKR
ncbi:flagellar biosynthesis protein FlhB [Brevibacillus laterosporus]|uniref:flagellar biosynthesis protein FlhB n=1 Tax=Brevibacillus laterosporus TaxID=1465 RepID=UPI000377E1A8|nr:flagellar biosynthesis protein FlhB [Brevibacillus laterosporus]ATO47940.1 flagellar biosynthesis protein FlhB [Brevibacillus laterosporus DSM 25]MBG9803819.1 flagellar biosynthesis protein FlhB [Brevibacillus laterosporus]MED2004016.1 flagellar biosynthesis protein FlhB [Brevibacillus laterosporus]MED4765660.1 flagellar biosynthesis protein FlhB [Brevibacillus laterosporus]TPH21943.1 flagellar biosynthesis protein FlhB [Brevibacillus laterosporus]